ncbi:MAG: hypothetical protein JKY67_00125 [Pseudomonadales bacterium]|nr:hypothetical protein [Pseudomonadales bacterium]
MVTHDYEIVKNNYFQTTHYNSIFDVTTILNHDLIITVTLACSSFNSSTDNYLGVRSIGVFVTTDEFFIPDGVEFGFQYDDPDPSSLPLFNEYDDSTVFPSGFYFIPGKTTPLPRYACPGEPFTDHVNVALCDGGSTVIKSGPDNNPNNDQFVNTGSGLCVVGRITGQSQSPRKTHADANLNGAQFTDQDPCPGNSCATPNDIPCNDVPIVYAVNCTNSQDKIPISINEIGDAATVEYQGSIYRVTGQQVRLEPFTVTPSDQECGEPESPIRLAYPCGGGTPITYDESDFVAGSLTGEYQGVFYEPSTDPSTDPPVQLAWSTEPCQVATRYIANACDGTLTHAYELTPGMNPGEGIVWHVTAQPTAFAPDCVRGIKLQCTADIAPDGMLPATNAQEAGACGDGPDGFENLCEGLGDTGPGPTGPFATAGPGLGDITARIIRAATLGKIKPCKGCQRRQAALNKIRLGKRR